MPNTTIGSVFCAITIIIPSETYVTMIRRRQQMQRADQREQPLHDPTLPTVAAKPTLTRKLPFYSLMPKHRVPGTVPLRCSVDDKR